MLRDDVVAVSRISAVPIVLRAVSEITGLRLSLIARVTADRWIACAVHDQMNFGLDVGGTLDVATTLCSKVRDTRLPVVINHASQDPDYSDHPTPKMYGFEGYIAVPIFLANGDYFGNLCALDSRPAEVTQPLIEKTMKAFAELIGVQLGAEADHNATAAQLLDAQNAAELREQFMAILGHDLRNPLAAVMANSEGLLLRPLNQMDRDAVDRILSSVRRMSALVNHLLDFARARLGSGLSFSFEESDDLELSLRQVVAELASAHPGRRIAFSCQRLGPVRCDKDRLGQLVSNLVSNALEHGASDREVDVRIIKASGSVSISVRNQGTPIPPAVLSLLFRPYIRGAQGSSKGLGLGLYIASEITQAHEGTLDVRSNVEDGTTFVFTFPLAAAARQS